MLNVGTIWVAKPWKRFHAVQLLTYFGLITPSLHKANGV